MMNIKAYQNKDLFRTLFSPFYGWALRRVIAIIRHHLSSGSITLTLPSGETLTADSGKPGPQAALKLNDYHAIWIILTRGDIGFSESYMSGLLDTDEIKNIFDLAVANEELLMEMVDTRGLNRFIAMWNHFQRDNSKEGSRKNIYAHYDLGNDFYSEWLDKSMTYSSAIYRNVTDKDETLFEAQKNKYRRIADIGNITPENHVLEIGCGWGGFAEFAAKEIGCKVTGVTISQAQYDYAAERIQKAGLNDKIELRIQDYRDIEHQSFDRVISIEMFEAVGERHWPNFFRQVYNILKPGGRVSMQIITIADKLFEDYRTNVDFIQRYIFPGGMLPSMAKLKELSESQGMVFIKNDAFRLDYARTLLEWNDTFQQKWDYLSKLPGRRFDEPFRRMWEYYLKYCASGFEVGRIDVHQIAWDRA